MTVELPWNLDGLNLHRSQIHEHDEEEEEQPMSHHEEQRRSSRQRKSRYHSYKETDITPYRWRRGSRSNGIDSPSADQVSQTMYQDH